MLVNAASNPTATLLDAVLFSSELLPIAVLLVPVKLSSNAESPNAVHPLAAPPPKLVTLVDEINNGRSLPSPSDSLCKVASTAPLSPTLIQDGYVCCGVVPFNEVPILC